MNDFLKWCFKISLNGVLWVFILSITVGGQTLFTRANELLVKNPLVEALDEELADLWQRLSKTARMTFSTPQPEEEKVM